MPSECLEWPLLVRAHWFKVLPESIKVATGIVDAGDYKWEEIKLEGSQYTFRGSLTITCLFTLKYEA